MLQLSRVIFGCKGVADGTGKSARQAPGKL